MVLRLYHYKKEPFMVFNVIKVTVDDNRTVVATVKERLHVKRLSFRIGDDYQRLTVQID